MGSKDKTPGKPGTPGDPDKGKAPTKQGDVDAGENLGKAQVKTQETATEGRVPGGEGQHTIPGTPGSSTPGGHTKPSGKPDPNGQPGGKRTKIDPNDQDPDNQRALRMENEAADTLAKNGYDVEQNPPVGGPRNPDSNPDYRIEGEVFDCYSPSTGSTRNIWTYVRDEKVGKGQADHVIINLDDPGAKGNVEALRKQFQDWPIPNLKEVKVIDKGGKIIDLYP